MKYKTANAKNAVKKGLVKVGDKVWVEVTVNSLNQNGFFNEYGQFFTRGKIRIPIPKHVPCRFEIANRILTNGTTTVRTTGYTEKNYFSAYVLHSLKNPAGYASCEWVKSDEWEDITEFYKTI